MHSTRCRRACSEPHRYTTVIRSGSRLRPEVQQVTGAGEVSQHDNLLPILELLVAGLALACSHHRRGDHGVLSVGRAQSTAWASTAGGLSLGGRLVRCDTVANLCALCAITAEDVGLERDDDARHGDAQNQFLRAALLQPVGKAPGGGKPGQLSEDSLGLAGLSKRVCSPPR